MVINRYISDLMFSNMYILTENGHSIIIDPFERCVLPDGLLPDMILITHEHYDHISGVNRMKRDFGIPLMCSAKCALRIVDPKKNSARYFDAFRELQTYGEQDLTVPIDTAYTCESDITFEEEIRFKWQGNQFYLFSLPGHSPGSIGIMVSDKYFFSGDSLLPDHDIELRFPGGSRKDWEKISVRKLQVIDDNVEVFPGHRDKFIMKERKNHGSI